MANYKGCTQKQIEALMPLEKEAKRIKRRIDFLKKRLAFEHAIFYEENIEIHQEIKELEHDLADTSAKITKIYGAKDEMIKHMRKAIEEVNIVEAIKAEWGIVTD